MIFKKILKNFFYSLGFKVSRLDKKYLYMRKMFRRIAKLDGDIVECGVGKMHTFRMLAELLAEENSTRILWGFDSFEGFPQPSLEDASQRNAQKGELKFINSEDVTKFLLILGFSMPFIDSHIKIVKGFFQDTLPNNIVSKIAFLHLDVDLYDSYKTCLKHLFPKVVKGGVVLFDEYNDPKWPGATKAINEYLNDKYKILKDNLTGKYYIIK